ncbi:MAG TPA: AAA family ATPase [Thermodesulfobacteriota bacterium]|nr:AAA family ATPase [Thermodesulfobacteriota bacterium]
MRLHWVELENWRRHAKTRIDFDEATTVIYGPNETGKSTILEALSRGFFDKSSSQAETIKRIRPRTASGNVISTVRIEFTLHNTRYRVEKNFNLRIGTSLYKMDGERSTLLDQDRSADERLIQLLEAELPSARGSKPSQWGAFQWLWTPQDFRELPTNEEGDPTTSLHLETKEGKDMLITQKFRAVQDMVQILYAQYFTGKGKPTKDSSILNTQAEIQILQEESMVLKDKIKKVDTDKQRLEVLQEELPELEKKLKETNEELEKARSEAMDFSSIDSELKASEASVREAERNVNDAKKALAELKKSAEKIEKLQGKEKDSREKLSRLEALCEYLERQQQEIKEKVEEKAMKIRECEELTRDARILWTKSDTGEKIEMLKKKAEKMRELDKTIESLREREVPIVPTSKELEELIQSQSRIDALRESLRTRGLAVSITPGKKGALEVEVDGERINDKELTATGTESVSIASPGLGKVTVEAKLEQARDAKVDIEHLEESILGALRKYSVKSIDELKELNRTQNNLSNDIKELLAERRGVDERLVNDVALELGKHKEKYAELEKIERTPNAIKSNPIDFDLGKLVNKREKEETEARKILDETRHERDNVDKKVIEKKEELVEIRAEQKRFSEELDTARIQERDLIRQYGSVENQETLLKTAETNLKMQREEYEKIKRRYEELEKGPINRIKRLEQQIKNQEQIIKQHQSSLDQLKGGISMASLEGTHSELAEIESQIEILCERIEREEIRAESYKLLKETLEQQHRSALFGVVGPIQEEVKRSLSYVTEFLHDGVELNEYLFPIRLGERGFDDISLEYNDGSSGLKEVLALCVRLAVAKHLTGRDSQCLVLDDPFVHVSSDRSNKMIELINDAIKEYGLQVIVFTHRPMEFAGFTGKIIDIQSVK